MPTTTTRSFHGNLLSAIFMALSLTVIYDVHLRLELFGPPPVSSVVTHVWCVIFGLAAWFWNNPSLSFLADSVGVLGSILTAHVEQYPVPWEPITLIPHFIWSLFLFSSNKTTSLRHKLLLGGVAFVAMKACAHYTHQAGMDLMLALFFIFLLYTGLHIGYRKPNADIFAMKLARLALAVLFVAKISSEMYQIQADPGYAAQAGFEIVKTTSFAAICLMAFGAFTRSKTLQGKVEKQQDQLYMAGLAVQASETAVAVTNAKQEILWANPAMENHFDGKGKNKGGHEPSIFHALSQLSSEDKKRLEKAYKVKGHQEGEISLDNATFRFEVAPFTSPKAGGKTDLVDGMDNSEMTATTVSLERDEGMDRTSAMAKHLSYDKRVRYVVVLKDITQQKARERAEKAAEQEALTAKAMQESMETLTHELRTPLQGIMGIASLLVSDKRLPRDATHNLQLVMASSSLLLVLINNLLDVRKCNVNMMEDFPLSPISCSSAIEDAISFCRPLAIISGIDVRASICQQSMVKSNSLRLQQVMINLISNAIKYSQGEERSIRISSKVKTHEEVENLLNKAVAVGGEDGHENSFIDSANQKVLTISVTDSGRGIPRGQERKLFHKFSMLDGQTESSGAKVGQPTGSGSNVGQPMGSGLGLQLCQKFVQRMNGRIWVENNKSGGSTFSFFLPLVEEDIFSPIDTDSPPLLPRRSRSRSHSEKFAAIPDCRLLLVDDTLINRKVFSRILAQFELRHIKVVESGKAALDSLKEEDFDIVITDVQMPGMNGLELSEAINESTSLKEKPLVIGITADTSQRIKQLCLLSGMLDVIYKPVTVTNLRHYFSTTVAQLLDARKCAADMFGE